MKLLVTGANGFIGKNLVAQLKNVGYNEIFEYDINCTEDYLIQAVKSCDFIFHFAGVNRPQSNSEFMVGNFDFTEKLLNLLIEHNNCCPILVTSSIQATLDNPYGVSKKASEDVIFKYGNVILEIHCCKVYGKIQGIGMPQGCKSHIYEGNNSYCNNQY